MIYPPEVPPALVDQHEQLQERLQRTYIRVSEFSLGQLTKDESREFMSHGVARRLRVIARCAQNIFSIFPPSRRETLDRDSLEDVNINLHAFVLHVNALQDNLAWAYVIEHGVVLKNRHAVSLFKEELKRQLPMRIQEFLNQESMTSWQKEYSTDFRDALAHRIPLYVPPAQLTKADQQRAAELNDEFYRLVRAHDFVGVARVQDEQNALGTACPQFAHSLRTSAHLVLHPQVICDGLTALELCDTVIKHWGAPISPPKS